MMGIMRMGMDAQKGVWWRLGMSVFKTQMGSQNADIRMIGSKSP